MQVNSDQWYVRWFLWNCRILDRWWHGPGESRREQRALSRGTDLCTFFRTIFLGTLAVVLNLMVWLYLLGVYLVAPFWLFNVITVSMSMAVFLGVVAAVVGVGIAVGLAPKAVHWMARKAQSAASDDPNQAPGFLQVVWRYLVGVKQRFCPTIIIREKNHD